MSSAPAWIAVGGLGAVGSLARFALDRAVSQRAGRAYPWGTFAVNVSGALALGLLTGLALRGTALLLAGTALLGSYTTFSTWMFESQRLAEDGEGRRAAINLAAGVAAGLAAAALGRWIGGGL